MHQPHPRPAPASQARPLYAALLAAGLILPNTGTAASDFLWTGRDPHCSQWACAGNWDNSAVPTAAGNLVFGDSVGTSSNNNLLSEIGSLTFAGNAKAMTLTGNAVSTRYDVLNLSAHQQRINMQVNVGMPAYPSRWDTVFDGGAAGISFKSVNLASSNLSIKNQVSIDVLTTGRGYPSVVNVLRDAALTTSFSSENEQGIYVGLLGPGATLNNKAAFKLGNYTTRMLIQDGGLFNDIGDVGTNYFGSYRPVSIHDLDTSFTVTGAGSKWLSQRNFDFSAAFYGDRKEFIVQNGAYMSTKDFSMGYASGPSGGNATFLVSAATLEVDGNLSLSGTISGRLEHAAVSAKGKATIASSTQLSLTGGTLSAASFSNSGKFIWNSGTLGITGAAGARLGDGMLSDSLLLDSGKGLLVTNTLEVGAGKALTVTDGRLATGLLSLRGGTVRLSDQAAAGNGVELNSGTLILTGAAGASAGKLLRNTPVLNAGKTLQLAGALTLDAGSSLSVDGGSLSARQLQLNGGTLALLNDSVVDSQLAFNSGTLRIDGNAGATLGAGIFDRKLTLAQDATLDVSKTLTIGNGATLQVAGGQLRAGTLALDGGTLRFEQDPAPQHLRWSSGTLSLGSSNGAALGSGALAQTTLVLGSERALVVDRTLSVGRNANLILDGGQFKAGTLALQGGRINGPLDMNNVGLLRGYGSVSGAVTGGAAARIVASGGMLTLGDGNDAAGYRFAGTLDAGGNRVWLLNQGAAQLGAATLLGDQGQLHSSDGLILAAGATLASTGNASIYGRFDNQGSVTSSGGTLSFYDDVSGSGSFAGQMLFRAGYNPGGAGASAQVGFGGGAASYDSHAILTMELLGSGHDRISGLSTFNFHGTLHLVFGDDFSAAPGSSIKLFDFQHFSGLLDGEHIVVDGYDRKQLDFSHLSTDGSIGVSAVPEPSTYALLLGGLGLLALCRRRAAGAR